MEESRYKYAYPLVLTPLKSDVVVDFSSTDIEAVIMEAVQAYNRSTAKSRTCAKEIINVQCKKGQIILTLTAAEMINSPGKALRTLSVNLVKHPYFENLLTEEGKLFTTSYEIFEEEEVKEKRDSIDAAILKSVADIVLGDDDTVLKKAKQEIKAICIKYNLLDKYM